VLLLMPYVQLPGTKFVILKTTLLKIILRLYSFRGDKALLGHREAVMHLKNSQLTRKILLRSTLGS
jgi:hypothetical protein